MGAVIQALMFPWSIPIYRYYQSNTLTSKSSSNWSKTSSKVLPITVRRGVRPTEAEKPYLHPPEAMPRIKKK